MLNPSDYDPNELRALTGAASPARDGDGDARWVTPADFLCRAEARVRATQVEDAFLLQAAAGGAERPYLPSLPGSAVGTRMALDWLSHLADVGGRSNARDALAFYVRVGWLGADAESALVDHLDAFPDGPGSSLGVGHHRTSLLFVARLAALR